jgi:nucleoside-diphosphate-sugar epimerase
MRILVTGNLGYIGSVLTPRLIDLDHEVVGLDCGFFRDCVLGAVPDDVPTVLRDMRDVRPEDIVGVDAVIHLAGLSNDPLGALVPTLTEDINFHATVRLANLAKDAGVKRFIYSSSQSMYGISTSDAELDEDNSVKSPVTAYARTKWAAETALRDMATPNFLTVSFRPSTVFGVSPRQRCDIVFNNLVGAGFTTGMISIKSDGSPWRPVVHVRDVCQAFEAGLNAPGEVINGRAFNVGPIGGNYTVRDLADAAQRANPGSSLEYTGEHGNDSRTYRISFDRINRDLKDYFQPEWNLAAGAKELVDHWEEIGFTEEMFDGPECTRLEQLRKLRSEGEISEDLRFV